MNSNLKVSKQGQILGGREAREANFTNGGTSCTGRGLPLITFFQRGLALPPGNYVKVRSKILANPMLQMCQLVAYEIET